MELRFTALTDRGIHLPFESSATETGTVYTLKKETFETAKTLRVSSLDLWQTAGSGGYYLLPRHLRMLGDPMVEFSPRPDTVYSYGRPLMSVFGISTPTGSAWVRVKRNYKYRVEIEVRNGVYSVTLLFNFTAEKNGDIPYEDITLEVIDLPADASLGDFAKTERELRLARGEIDTLAEKCKRDAVEYGRKYPVIRIRMGWKPVPSPVPHQNPQNEPPVHVACTFEKVRKISDELKKQGVEGAELQLVGWNIGGHDGRWPQLLPAEPVMGGDEELKKTVAYVKALGYRISLHTNLVDSYEIGDGFDWNNLATHRKGTHLTGGSWGGGLSYRVCPLKQLENEEKFFPAVADLGVNGIHFTDVMSIIEPDNCSHTDHPCSTGKGIETVEKLAGRIQRRFGAFSSEGALDFALKHLDYALYVTFGDGFDSKVTFPFCEKTVPFWELIYHGVLLYNPMAPTVNFSIQPARDQLNFFLRGGRPTFYFHTRFRTGTDGNFAGWMGNGDLTCGSDGEITESVAAVARGLKEYEPFADRQLIYMTDYEIPGNGLEIATYADGVKIVGNFAEEPRTYENVTVEPGSFIVL